MTRGMAGAGVLALALGGLHNTEIARAAGDWILQHPHPGYNRSNRYDPYHYGTFYSSQAMFQLGGHYWQTYYPRIVQVLLANQAPDGHWENSPDHKEGPYGNVYSTALVVLSLSPPSQLLPIFQR